MSDISTDSGGQQAEEFTEPSACPLPTPAEEAAADRSRDRVDVDRVGEHEREMNARGAHTDGEGRIESVTD
jgi:hypothetical protein